MESESRVQGAVQSLTRFFSRKPRVEAPPRLHDPIRYPFGEFEFRVSASAGQVVELQISRDFKHWEPLEAITVAKESAVVSDKKAGTYGALFYRAVSGSFRSNYLGFVSFDIPPGYSMITNPLHAPSNQLSALFPAVPEETTISKFNVMTFSLGKATFVRKAWSSPTETLLPGEGALFFNPGETPIVARFVGEAPQVPQSLPIQTGTSIRASMLPLAGRLDTDLGFPFSPGDVVSLYSNHNEKYLEFKFQENGWAGEPPVIRLGEAFWIAKNTSGTWVQKLPDPIEPD